MLELAYAQKVTDTECTATSEATADLILAAAAINLGGSTTIIVEFVATAWGQSSTSPNSNLALYDNGSSIGIAWSSRSRSTPFAEEGGVFFRRRLTPSAGSHTFDVRGYVSSASTFTVAGGPVDGGGDLPCWIRITTESEFVPRHPAHDHGSVTIF